MSADPIQQAIDRVFRDNLVSQTLAPDTQIYRIMPVKGSRALTANRASILA